MNILLLLLYPSIFVRPSGPVTWSRPRLDGDFGAITKGATKDSPIGALRCDASDASRSDVWVGWDFDSGNSNIKRTVFFGCRYLDVFLVYIYDILEWRIPKSRVINPTKHVDAYSWIVKILRRSLIWTGHHFLGVRSIIACCDLSSFQMLIHIQAELDFVNFISAIIVLMPDPYHHSDFSSWSWNMVLFSQDCLALVWTYWICSRIMDPLH